MTPPGMPSVIAAACRVLWTPCTRGKIQEESMYYEHKKHDGSLPLVVLNMFPTKEHAGEIELIRRTEEKKARR